MPIIGGVDIISITVANQVKRSGFGNGESKVQGIVKISQQLFYNKPMHFSWSNRGLAQSIYPKSYIRLCQSRVLKRSYHTSVINWVH